MNYQEFKQAVIAAAAEKEVKDYELYYSESAETQTEIFKEEVKGFNTSSSLGVCLKCLVNGKMGYASTEHLSEEEAVSLVERALDNATSIESEEQSFIHKKGDTYAVLEKEEIKLPTAAELIDFSLALQKQLYATDSRVVDGTQAYAGFVESKSALYNSNGLDLEDSAAFSFTYGMAVVPRYLSTMRKSSPASSASTAYVPHTRRISCLETVSTRSLSTRSPHLSNR